MNKKIINYNVSISIIIVTYNSIKYIKDCIDSIFSFSFPHSYELILIDNSSFDDIEIIIRNSKEDIIFIKNKENLGFAKACNQGINIAKGKYIFLLNPDTELSNDVLEIFLEFMKKKENELVWCVGAQLYDEYNNPSKSYGHFPTLLDVIFEQFGIKGLLLMIPKLRESIIHNFINQNKKVPFVMGCNLFIRRSVLEKIGLFNELFFLNYEETELSWRANKAGFISLILPEAKILHYSGKSFPNLQSYLNHLWIGQVLFFKLTHHRLIFLLAKAIHLIGAMLRFIFKFDKIYLTHAKKILSV